MNDLDILSKTLELRSRSLVKSMLVLVERLPVLRKLLKKLPHDARLDPLCGVPKKATPAI
jgi:hypothetical protein